MAHAEHFLERLDRLSAQHTEEALLLYNDPPLLLTILEMARVPEGVERVALALDEEGPYLLVTRSGHFVTCLAAGMSLKNVVLVSRQQLDGFTSKVGELRARFELARSLVGTDRRGSQKLVDRICEAGADLSREEFAALVLFQPMLVVRFLRSLFDLVDYLPRARDKIAATRLGKKSRQIERILRDYWNAYWAAGHLSLLLATGGPETFDPFPPDLSEHLRSVFAWGTVRQGGVGLALRGAWSVGRFGKPMLSVAKHNLRVAGSPVQFLVAALSLLALGVRHQGLRAEALKALGTAPEETAFDGAPLLHEAVYSATIKALEDPAEAAKKTRVFAEASLAERRLVRRLPPIALPDALRLAVVGLDISNYQRDSLIASFLPAMLSQVGPASAEDLYLPRADLAAFGHGPWTPDHTLALIDPLPPIKRPSPAVAIPAPGPNDPCACGSGKKFKKCCR